VYIFRWSLYAIDAHTVMMQKAANMPGRCWRCGFVPYGSKADIPQDDRGWHSIQPLDPRDILVVTAMPALSESDHRDRVTEASDTLHRQ
jgi:hypothetical protein